MWELLPDLILEEIFLLLSVQERYNAAMVCRSWSTMITSPRVWRIFVLGGRFLTRHKFNYYMGYEHVIDHYRTQICLHRTGRFIRTIIIKPMPNFFNLYEFIKTLYQFAELTDKNRLKDVQSLQFSFACHLAESGVQEYVFGTGGKLLDSLKRLLWNLPGLKHLSLENLLLDSQEAVHLLDSVAQNCFQTLKTLELINCTKFQYPLFPVGIFLAIEELKISPQHLNDDIVTLLSSTTLRNMFIIQTEYTDSSHAVSKDVWKECSKSAPKLNVHLIIDGPVKNLEVIWQPKAPVRSILYRSPFIPVSSESILTACELYKEKLRAYGHLGIPKFSGSKCFHERADSALVLLCRHCPQIQNLIIRERISTSTVLLISHSAKNLKNYFVRRNAVIKKCDWPHSPEWTEDFYYWLHKNAMSYDDTNREVSQLLGKTFSMLDDKKFKALDLLSLC